MIHIEQAVAIRRGPTAFCTSSPSICHEIEVIRIGADPLPLQQMKLVVQDWIDQVLRLYGSYRYP